MRCKHCGAGTRVLATRKKLDGHVLERQRACFGETQHKFSTYEIDDDLERTILQHAMSPERGATLAKRVGLQQRNQNILDDLVAGKKHSVVAKVYGLAPNSVSTIARRAGLPAYRDLAPFLRHG